jgi:protocatechuate 3,4-dioxygenase beta subunit
VRDAGSCEPLPDAVVDIWHADAGGAYSGFDGGDGGGGGGGPGGGGGGAQTESRYLRGAQVTNGEGVVEFTTIYPGWYPGRTVHIHVKVHLDAQTALTTQLYFADALSDRVYAAQPYAARGRRDQGNGSDGIFDAALVMTAQREGDGVRGVMTFDVQKA